MTPDVITQAAFARGRILHGGTGEPIAGDIDIAALEGPVVGRVLADGTFVLSGYLPFLFPLLATQAYTLNLRIRVTSPQLRAGAVTLPLILNVPAGPSFDPDPPAAPRALIQIPTILLTADPLSIRGRVVEAEDPTAPIQNATVEVLHAGPAVAPVVTGADGRYRFDGVTLVAPVQVRASHANFLTVTRAMRPEYGLLVNEENFRLPPP
jgi:hypothetical protein